MAATMAQMPKRELPEMLETLIEQKLLDLLGDPDAGVEIRKSVRDRLLRQRKAVAAREQGKSLARVMRRLHRGSAR